MTCGQAAAKMYGGDWDADEDQETCAPRGWVHKPRYCNLDLTTYEPDSDPRNWGSTGSCAQALNVALELGCTGDMWNSDGGAEALAAQNRTTDKATSLVAQTHSICTNQSAACIEAEWELVTDPICFAKTKETSPMPLFGAICEHSPNKVAACWEKVQHGATACGAGVGPLDAAVADLMNGIIGGCAGMFPLTMPAFTAESAAAGVTMSSLVVGLVIAGCMSFINSHLA